MVEIIKYRRDGGYLIPKAAFYRICPEIVAALTLEQLFPWHQSAVECLQVVADELLVMLMTSRLHYHPNKII